MRNFTTTEQNLFASGSLETRVRVYIWNGTAYSNYDGWAISGSIRQDIDMPTAQASLSLVYVEGATNFSPLRTGGGAIDINRPMYVEAGVASPGGAVLNWHRIFEGDIDSLEMDDSTMQIEARDLGGRLMDRWVETATKYGTTGGRAMELVIGDILSGWASGTGLTTLWTPTSPGFNLYEWQQEPRAVLEVIREVAAQIGWDVRLWWNPTASAYQLRLADPGRNTVTPLYTLSPSVYRPGASISIDRDPIRNVISLDYGPANARATLTVSDSASISRYGRRWAGVTEGAQSPINTSAEASAYVNAILSDLKDPKAEYSIETDLFPWAELFDLYRFSPNNIQFDANQDLAVVSVSHQFRENGEHITQLLCRGKPAGSYYGWHNRILPEPDPPANIAPPDAPTGLGGNFSGRDAVLAWNPVQDAIGYEVRVYSSSILRRTERVGSAAYTYDYDRNVADHGTPVPSLSFEVRALRGDRLAMSSPATLSLTNLPPPTPTGLTLVGQPLYFLFSVNEPTFSDYLRLEVEADDSGAFPSPTPAHKGPDWQGIRIGLEAGASTTYVRARFVDVFGQTSGWATVTSNGVLVGSSQIAAGAVGTAQFASNIKPVEIVSTLPTLPNASYPQGAVVFLTSDNKLYRSTGSSWTAAVPATDLSGQITTTQISNGSISTPKLAAGAVTANELAANSVVAGKIAAGAISTNELAARAVTIDKLVVTDWSNLVTNTLIDGSSSGWFWVGIVADTSSGYPYVAEQPDRDGSFAYGNPIPCEAGKYYYAGCLCKNSGASTYPFSVGIVFWDSSNNAIGWYSAATAPVNTTSWTNIGGIVQAPSNAVKMTFWTLINKAYGAETNKPWRYTNPVLRRANSGELIVDGSITANKLTALDLSALTGTFGGGNNKTAIDNRGVRVYDSSAALTVAVGNISGLSDYEGNTLPANSYGTWLGPNANFYGNLGTNVLAKDFPKKIVTWNKSGVVTVPSSGEIVVGQLDLSSGLNDPNSHKAQLVGISLYLPTGMRLRIRNSSNSVVYNSENDSLTWPLYNRGTRNYYNSYIFNPASLIAVALYNSSGSAITVYDYHTAQLTFVRYPAGNSLI